MPTLVDLLEVKDDTVFNCLVDRSKVDQILVIPTDRQAQQLLGQEENVPQHCERAVTEQGFQFYPAPRYRSYPQHSGLGNTRLLNFSVSEAEKEIKQEVCQGRFSEVILVVSGV